MFNFFLSLPFGSRPKLLGSLKLPWCLGQGLGLHVGVSHAAAQSLIRSSKHEETLHNDNVRNASPARGFYFLVMPWRSGSPQWLWDFWVKIGLKDPEDLLSKSEKSPLKSFFLGVSTYVRIFFRSSRILPHSHVVHLAPKLLLLRLNRASIEVS